MLGNNVQGSAAWRQERAGFVTGSGFAHVIGKRKDGKGYLAGRQTYKLQLVIERLTGIPSREIQANPLDWGKQHEDAARTAYEVRMDKQGEPVFVERVGFQEHKSIPWVGTSPDGLVGEHGMVEIKCPYDSGVHITTLINASGALASALSGTNAPLVMMPEGYVAQVQGNLWVLERDWCDYISYDPRVPAHLRLYVSRIYRDDKFIKSLEAEVLKFLDEVEESVAMLLDPKDGFPIAANDQQPEGVAA